MSLGKQLARIIGFFSSVLPADLLTPLHYCALQSLYKASGYTRVQLWPYCKSHRRCKASSPLVRESPRMINGQPIHYKIPSITNTSDASLSRWRATSAGVDIGGAWSNQKCSLHFNCLELLAALFAVKSFVEDIRNVLIYLLMDNKTAIAYVNHLGGTRSPKLQSIASELWELCLKRD